MENKEFKMLLLSIENLEENISQIKRLLNKMIFTIEEKKLQDKIYTDKRSIDNGKRN